MSTIYSCSLPPPHQMRSPTPLARVMLALCVTPSFLIAAVIRAFTTFVCMQPISISTSIDIWDVADVGGQRFLFVPLQLLHGGLVSWFEPENIAGSIAFIIPVAFMWCTHVSSPILSLGWSFRISTVAYFSYRTSCLFSASQHANFDTTFPATCCNDHFSDFWIWPFNRGIIISVWLVPLAAFWRMSLVHFSSHATYRRCVHNLWLPMSLVGTFRATCPCDLSFSLSRDFSLARSLDRSLALSRDLSLDEISLSLDCACCFF